MRRIATTLAVVVALLFSAGSAWADFDDGWAAFERGDYATALRVFRPLAEQGDSASQFTLAGMYINGWGVPKNNAEAVKLYRKAAEQGLSLAQFILGIYHSIDLGVGVPRDNVLRRRLKGPYETARRKVVAGQNVKFMQSAIT